MKKFLVCALFLLLAACATPSVLEQKAPPSVVFSPTAVPANEPLFRLPEVSGGTLQFVGDDDREAHATPNPRDVITGERYDPRLPARTIANPSKDGTKAVVRQMSVEPYLPNTDIYLFEPATGKETHIPFLKKEPRDEYDNDGYVYQPYFAWNDTQVVMTFCANTKHPIFEGVYIYDIATGKTRVESFDDGYFVYYTGDDVRQVGERFLIGNPGGTTDHGIYIYELTQTGLKRLDFPETDRIFTFSRGDNVFGRMDEQYLYYCTVNADKRLCLNRVEIATGAKKTIIFTNTLAEDYNDTNSYFYLQSLLENGEILLEITETLPDGYCDADWSSDSSSSDEDDPEPRVKYAVLTFD